MTASLQYVQNDKKNEYLYLLHCYITFIILFWNVKCVSIEPGDGNIIKGWWLFQGQQLYIRGFAKLKKIDNKTHPPPLNSQTLLETHHWHGENAQIILTNNF